MDKKGEKREIVYCLTIITCPGFKIMIVKNEKAQ